MKKSLFLSSFIIGLVFLGGCKIKKNSTLDKDLESHNSKSENVLEQKKDGLVVIPQPGTLDQEKLDSIKAIRMKEKRRYKK